MSDVRASQDLPVDQAELTGLLKALVAIPSVNPDLEPDSPGEAAIGEYVADYCRDLGLEVARQEVGPGRSNVLARLEAPGSTRTLLLDSHLDTQSLRSMGSRALSGEVVNGRLYGRGACDDKGSLAAMLYAMKLLTTRRDELVADVLFLGSIGEEVLMNGIKTFQRSGPKVDAAVVGEPTDLQVVVAHKGFVRFTLTTHGRAAHTANPEKGDNAVYQMAEVIRFVRDDLSHRWDSRSHPLLGTPTLAIGRIWGGIATNVVPESCVVDVDRRSLPSEEPEAILAEIDAALAELMRAHPEVKVTREPPTTSDRGLDTPPDAPIVRAAVDACQAILGRAEVVGVRYATNASTLAGVGKVPTIVLGPGSILQAHTADEYVPLDEVAAAARIYARTALGFGR